jgi:DNA-binding NarL/FixJ family response regulator
MPIKVAITDDHPLATAGIISMLQPFPNIEIAAIYHSAAALLEGLAGAQPDILLLDILLPDKSGKDLAPFLKETYPQLKVIALTSLDAPVMVSGMMRRGCKGYLLKDTSPEILLNAIEEVYAGKEFIEPSIQEKLLKNLLNFSNNKTKVVPEITLREKEVLHLIAEENTTQEIADKLFISFRTVENHRYSLMQKLEVKNTVGLVKVAIRLGLVE